MRISDWSSDVCSSDLQFIDRTFAREKSFFGPGMVAHVSVADPVCARLGDALEAAGRELGLPLRRAGTYMVMEGPQFSTRAESQLYRSWGCDVLGMTNMPGAKQTGRAACGEREGTYVW